MNQFLEKFKKDCEKVKESFVRDIKNLKTGRATPSLVENILVESYGQKMPLIQLASISTPDMRTIVIQPWDKNNVGEIEKAIAKSELGVNPSTSESTIRINIPQPTEESRKEVIKILHQKLEEFRVSLKRAREEVKDLIIQAEADKEINEDEKFKNLEELDEEIKKFNNELKEISDKKEKDILTI